MEMGPLLKASSVTMVKPRIEPVTPDLQGKWFIHYTTAVFHLCLQYFYHGAQWFSGRVLDPRRGAVGSSLTGITALWSLSKAHLSLLSTGSTQEDPSLFN